MTLGAPLSIRKKLLAVVLLTTLVALVVALGAIVGYDLRSYHRSLISDMTTQAELLGRTIAPALAFDDAKVAAENLGLLKFRPQIQSAAIYTARGRLFASFAREKDAEAFPKLPENDGQRIEGQDLILFKRIVSEGDILGTVYLRADYELYQRVLDYLGIAAVVMIAALLAALATSARLQRLITDPIVSIAGIAREVVEGRDYSRRAKKMSTDEVGTLVDSFNGMLTEIERRTQELEASNREVSRLNTELEGRVQERTAQLESANRELESFSYSVSHDLRAPLRAIDGYALMLEEDYAARLDDEGRRLLGVVRESSGQMARLIDDLLAFSQVGRKSLSRGQVDMAVLAREVVSDLTREKSVARVEVGELPAAEGDRPLLKQVWSNLVSNALKYSGKRELPLIQIGGRVEGREWIYWVRDNGTGFDMRYYSKLFGVFQRLHRAEEFEGTGVGLAIVQRIVLRHGGRVWAEGAIGEGACFRFALPMEV